MQLTVRLPNRSRRGSLSGIKPSRAPRARASCRSISIRAKASLAGVAQLFQKKYPEIIVTTVTGRGNQLGPRIMAERRAGKFLVDAYIAGLTSTYEILYRGKILDPVRATLILPEVLDESKWWQGQHHYIDPENKYIFVFV